MKELRITAKSAGLVCLAIVTASLGLVTHSRAQGSTDAVAYYSMQHADDWPPLPANIFGLPETALGDGAFAINDLDLDYEAVAESLHSFNGGGQYSLNSGLPDFDEEGEGGEPPEWNGAAAYSYSNQLWLEIVMDTNSPGNATLILHNTKQDYWYQLLSATNVAIPQWKWALGQIFQDVDGTNSITFNPVPIDKPMRFYRALEGTNVAFVFSYNVNAIEPNTNAGFEGQVGSITVGMHYSLGSAVPANYRMSGQAAYGVDYTNSPGPLNSNLIGSVITAPYGTVFIYPFEDSILEFEESVVLTLIPGNGYVIDPASASTSITISDYFPTNLFGVVCTNVNFPIGIDYDPATNSLIVSAEGGFTVGTQFYDFDFVRLGTNGAGQLTVTNWSGISGLEDEVKLATVKATANGFTNGQVFFGNNGLVNRIGMISPNGAVSNLSFATLTNDTFVRGGLYVDQSGSFGGDLIAVTASDDPGVWRVHADGTSVRVTSINTSHLEGVITLTNDPAKWGPWAGKIITGDENQHAIYTISSGGIVTTNFLGIDPEDFDIIPPNQNLYACDPDRNVILKLSASYLTNYVGDLLITQAGEVQGSPPKLFIVNWDGTNFVSRSITYFLPNGTLGHFEHVTFAPIDIPPLNQ